MLKARDSGMTVAILLVSASRTNRSMLREAGGIARINYPISSSDALACLEAGTSPGGNAIVML